MQSCDFRKLKVYFQIHIHIYNIRKFWAINCLTGSNEPKSQTMLHKKTILEELWLETLVQTISLPNCLVWSHYSDIFNDFTFNTELCLCKASGLKFFKMYGRILFCQYSSDNYIYKKTDYWEIWVKDCHLLSYFFSSREKQPFIAVPSLQVLFSQTVN